MPQHKSAIKRVRQNKKRRQHNKIKRSKMRSLIKDVLETEDKAKATELFKEAQSYLDRVATKGLIHKNQAANKKRKMRNHVNNL